MSAYSWNIERMMATKWVIMLPFGTNADQLRICIARTLDVLGFDTQGSFAECAKGYAFIGSLKPFSKDKNVCGHVKNTEIGKKKLPTIQEAVNKLNADEVLVFMTIQDFLFAFFNPAEENFVFEGREYEYYEVAKAIQTLRPVK